MSRTTHMLALVVICTAGSGATVGRAQVISPPPRVFQVQRPIDRLIQTLRLEINVLGGYDDNVTPEGAFGQAFVPRDSSYTGSGAARFHYSLGREERSLGLNGGFFVNTFSDPGIGPGYGGDVQIRGRTEVGRNTEVGAAQIVRDRPFFGLGSFQTLQPGDPAQPVIDTSTADVFEPTRSTTLSTSASVRHRWTARTTTDFRYNYDDTGYEDAAAFDSRRHGAAVIFNRDITNDTGFQSEYRYSDFASLDPLGRGLPVQDHTVHVGFRYGRGLSATRRLETSGGVGTIYTETVSSGTGLERRFWSPSGYVSASVDLGRTWSLSADYRRRVTVLQGLTPQPFLTDAATIQAGGLVTSRLQGSLLGLYSNGSAGAGTSLEPGRFDNYALVGQLQVLVTPWWSAVISLTHYRYNLNTIASQSIGVPPRLNRNAAHVGLAWSLPLVGPVDPLSQTWGRRSR